MFNQVSGNNNAAKPIQSTCEAPVRSTQVDDQMSSICYALDQLESVGEQLIRRLEPVTGPLASSGGGNSTGVPLVPLASRLSNVQARISMISDGLASVLSSLEV
jgi:hypothetical protein